MRDVIMRGPFLAVPSSKHEHVPQEPPAAPELSSTTPSPDTSRPALPHLPSSAYTPSHGPEPAPPRVHFRSRVRIRGKRRSTTRPHSAPAAALVATSARICARAASSPKSTAQA